MCKINLALAGIAAVSTIFGAVQSANAAEAQGEYQASIADQQAQQAKQRGIYEKSVADYNAQIAMNQAQAERNKATEDERAHRLKTAQLGSRQKAQLGAGNILTTAGSALQIQEDAATLGEADALRIRAAGDDRYQALESQAELDRSRGEWAKRVGDSATSQGDYLRAAGQSKGQASLLGGVAGAATGFLGSGVADKWFDGNSAANTAGITAGTKAAKAALKVSRFKLP